jgi:hypothetical protein
MARSIEPKKKNKHAPTSGAKKKSEILTDEELNYISEEAYRAVKFDAHFVTAKIVELGILLTGKPLYTYQKMIAYRIIYSVITFEGAVITVILSRQSGKSETLAFVANALSVLVPALAAFLPDLEPYSKGVRLGIFAPQSEQVWSTYNRALEYLNTELATEIMEDEEINTGLERPTKHALTNGSRMIGQVASKQSKIEGATHDIIFCEEAQDLDSDIVSKSIEPMLSSTNGTLVKVGTTGTQKNHYWYEILANRKDDRNKVDHRLLNHWEFNYIKIIQARQEQYLIDNKGFHLKYETFVKGQLKRYGKDSPFFKLSYALEWDLESGMLITDKEFNSLTNKKKKHKIEDNDVVIAGLDIAKDNASTVVTLGKLVWEPNEEQEAPKIEICGWLELKNIDYERQHHLIIEYLFENNVVNMFADYTGVGKPVVDRLRFAVGESINIEPYTFSTQSKSEMWFNLLAYISTKRLIIPAHSELAGTAQYIAFEEQMKNCTKTYNGPYIVCEKSDGYYDDYVDSLALMVMANSFEQIDDEITEEENEFYENQLINRNLRSQNEWLRSSRK